MFIGIGVVGLEIDNFTTGAFTDVDLIKSKYVGPEI